MHKICLSPSEMKNRNNSQLCGTYAQRHFQYGDFQRFLGGYSRVVTTPAWRSVCSVRTQTESS